MDQTRLKPLAGPQMRRKVKEGYLYLIPKNKHYARRMKRFSVGLIRSIFSLLPFMLIRGYFSSLTAVMTIHRGNWHTNPDPANIDWKDINKLIGVNLGLGSPHDNSFRIGWINDYHDPGYVNLYLYYYKDGTRHFTPVEKPICRVRTGEPLEIVLQAHSGDRMYIHVYQNEHELYENDIRFVQINQKYFSVLEPYHGGQLKAFKDLRFDLFKIQTTYTK